MRVPFYVVIPICCLVMLAVWWTGTRGRDFMTPPSPARLEQVRKEAIAALPDADKAEDAISPVNTTRSGPPAPAVEQKPAFDLGDISRPPQLHEYADSAIHGAEHLISLALHLERKGHFQRALLAWERVIDHSKPNTSQRRTAISSIIRLRPTLPDWNTDPARADPLILHAGTGKKSAEMLTVPLEAIARKLNTDSSGLINITAQIAAGRSDLSRSGASPVAIWLSGPQKNSLSTEVISFTFEKPDELPSQLESAVFALIRGYLARNTTLSPIPDLPADQINAQTLHSSVTRYAWKNLGALLNRPDPNIPEKPAAAPPAKKTSSPARSTSSKTGKPKKTTRRNSR